MYLPNRLIIVACALAVFLASGCATSRNREMLERQLASGMTGLVVQEHASRAWWKDDQGKELHFRPLNYDSRHEAAVVTQGFAHMAGVTEARRRMPGISDKPRSNRVSTLGTVSVHKPPEETGEWDRVNDDWEWVVTRRETMYFLNYDFPPGSPPWRFGVGRSEILLIPGVTVEMEPYLEDCTALQKEKVSVTRDMLDLLLFPITVFVPDGRPALSTNGSHTWEWTCPLKSVTLTVRPADRAAAVNRIEAGYLPEGTLPRLEVRELEPGPFLEGAAEKRELPEGGWQYVFRDGAR